MSKSIESIGRYTIERLIARGGMAEVFLTRVPGFATGIVVKRILPECAEDPRFVNMFRNEAHVASMLNHPNIARVFDFGSHEGRSFLAMEYVEGVSLRQMLQAFRTRAETMPVRAAARLAAGVCEGLHYAHEYRDGSGTPLHILHRDISPDNLMVSLSGTPKIVDFGIAKAANAADPVTRGLKGRFPYMPPELIRDGESTREMDVYALGVTLYEMVVGRRPFRAESDAGLLHLIMEGKAQPAHEANPTVPFAFSEIISRAMHPVRAKRFPDCRSLQGELEGYLAEQGETGPSLAALVRETMEQRAAAEPRVTSSHFSVVPLAPTPMPDESTELLSQVDVELAVGAAEAREREERRIAVDEVAAAAALESEGMRPAVLAAGVATCAFAMALAGIALFKSKAEPTRFAVRSEIAAPAIEQEQETAGALDPSESAAAALEPNAAKPAVRASPVAEAQEGSAALDSPDVPKTSTASGGQNPSGTSTSLRSAQSERGLAAEAQNPSGTSTSLRSAQSERGLELGFDPERRASTEAPAPATDTLASAELARKLEAQTQLDPTDPLAAAALEETMSGFAQSRSSVPRRPLRIAESTRERSDIEEGFLTVRSESLSEVYLDGQKVGTTPLLRLPVSAGEHVIELQSAEGKGSRKMSVNIEAGSEEQRAVHFE